MFFFMSFIILDNIKFYIMYGNNIKFYEINLMELICLNNVAYSDYYLQHDKLSNIASTYIIFSISR